jgi:hypothetical protein
VDRRQRTITISAVVLSVLLGAGITLLATSGDGSERSLTTAHSTTSSSSSPSTTATVATTPTTGPIVTVPTRPPPTVVVIPPPPTTRRRPRTTTTAPASTTPTAPATTAAPGTTAAPSTAPATTAPPTTAAPGPGPTVPASTSTTASAPTTIPSADPGLSRHRLRVAVITDDPATAAGARAWATGLKTGVAGRSVRVDVLATNGTAEGYRAAVANACTRDFAIVASLTETDTATSSDCGIPDVPVEALSDAHRQQPTTFATFPARAGTEPIGGFRYVQSTVDGCCTQYVLVPDQEPARSRTRATIKALDHTGFTTAAAPDVAASATDNDYDDLAADLEASGANLAWSGLGRDSTISLRRAAVTAGVSDSTAWICDARCYDDAFIEQGSTAVEGEYVAIDTVPFSDRRSVPGLAAYLRATARNGDPRSYGGLRGYVAGLLFQQAVERVVESHGADGLTRARVLDALAAIHDFTGGGIVGPTDVGARKPSGCTVVLQVRDGHFLRSDPDGRGNLDCSSENLVELKP